MKKTYIAPEFEELLIDSSDEILNSPLNGELNDKWLDDKVLNDDYKDDDGDEFADVTP